MYMGSDTYDDPFNVDELRRMLAARDYSAVGEPDKPFMSREECEQKSREISAADVIFAHGMGIDLTQ